MAVQQAGEEKPADARQVIEQFKIKLSDVMIALDIRPRGHVIVSVWPNGEGITISRQTQSGEVIPHGR